MSNSGAYIFLLLIMYLFLLNGLRFFLDISSLVRNRLRWFVCFLPGNDGLSWNLFGESIRVLNLLLFMLRFRRYPLLLLRRHSDAPFCWNLP
jgi:hypothetical protein